MAFDEKLADRVREQFMDRMDVEEKKMFGGLSFMVSSHMCCGIIGDMLMARVGPDQYERCLGHPHAREMDFTGRSLKGMVYVDAEGVATAPDLAHWVGLCRDFVDSLPPKKQKKKQ